MCREYARRFRPVSHRSPRVGFTLIELLVVVSIIALLLSILLPSLSRAREQAKLLKCLSNARGLAQAATVFASDRDGRFQLATDEIGVNTADSDRNRFAYGTQRELLAWPVALGQAAGFKYRNNWDWGVRATTFTDARNKKEFIKDDFKVMVCPADKVQISTPFYPRYKSPSNNGLKGSGDPANPIGAVSGMSYWGLLSYGINEDICGVEVEESGPFPACWRAVQTGSGWQPRLGEYAYAPSDPGYNVGWRLRGTLDKVFDPGRVGLVFEAGADSDTAATSGEFANLIISAKAQGPYLGDFQQFFRTRMPNRRHQGGRLNVLFADMHGESVRPVEYRSQGGGEALPSRYSPRVRVSPYNPRGF